MRFAPLILAVAVVGVIAAAVVLVAFDDEGEAPDASAVAPTPNATAVASPEASATPVEQTGLPLAPDGRTGDPAVDQIIDDLVGANAAELAEKYADVMLREYINEADVFSTPEEWTARLTAGERSLYAVTREPEDSGIFPSRDFNVVLSVRTGGEEPVAWRVAIENGEIVALSAGTSPPAASIPSVGFFYDHYVVLPPESDLPQPPPFHALDTRTGEAGVDALLALIEAGDGDDLAAAAALPVDFERCRILQPQRDDVATRRIAEVAKQAIGIHSVARVPNGHLPAADHQLLIISELSPYEWQMVSLLELDGSIVGFDLCGVDTPSYLYTPLSYVVPPVADLADLDVERRSGINVIDAFLDALATENVGAMLALVSYQEMGCILEAEGIGGPPICEEGEPEGTVLQVLLAASCEGYFMRRENVEQAFINLVGRDWAVYSVTDPGEPDKLGLVQGSWQVILVDTSAAEDSFQRFLSPWFNEAGLAALFYGCAEPHPGDLERPGTNPDFLLPPLG
jgi:hypothetical protein